MFDVCCCLLRDVCLLFFVFCYVLFDVFLVYVLFEVCLLLFVVRFLLFVLGCSLFVAGVPHFVYIFCCLLHVVFHLGTRSLLIVAFLTCNSLFLVGWCLLLAFPLFYT